MSSEASSSAAAVVPPAADKPVVKSAWSPLAVPIFRSLWIGYVLSQIGMNAREAGSQFLMSELVTNPHERSSWVGYIGTSFYLPLCALSIAAGVWADITDRRRLLILTNLAILVASALLGIITLVGLATPVVLLVFLFILGIATALSGPAFQYVIPELVPPKDMPLAISLNSVALNVGRAIGPALGMASVSLVGMMIASKTKGAGAAFLINALGFLPVVWVLIRWNRAPQKESAHPETWLGATQTAFKYTAHSPAMRAILIRVLAFITCAVIVWTQIVIIAKVQLRGDLGMIGFMMAAVGTGAVIGVFCMPKLERKFSTDGMVMICTAVFGLAVMGLSQCKGTVNTATGQGLKALPLGTLCLATLLAVIIGFNWVIVPTNFNIATQRSVPPWVKGRAIAMYMTVLWGSFAFGSWLWGHVADHVGISNASLIAGSLILLGLLLVKPFPLTRASGLDFAPLGAATPEGFSASHTGPLSMNMTYGIPASRVEEFTTFMRNRLRAQRLRNGAKVWKLTQVRVDPGTDVSTFEESVVFGDWSHRLQYHGRTTRADAEEEARLQDFLVFGESPRVDYRTIQTPVSLAAEVTKTAAISSRKMHYPPPIVDFNRIILRMLEEFDAIWNRAVRDWYDRRG